MCETLFKSFLNLEDHDEFSESLCPWVCVSVGVENKLLIPHLFLGILVLSSIAFLMF